MKPWTENQRSFISQHLQVDMTAAELARFFHVAPQDIWQLAREEQWPASPTMGPIALHTPGGGGLLTTVFLRAWRHPRRPLRARGPRRFPAALPAPRMGAAVNSRKGLKRYGMRAYLVAGPLGAIVIRRLSATNYQVRHQWSDAFPWGLWGMRFPRLGDARTFAEREVGLK